MTRATSRLAHYADPNILDGAKLRGYVTSTPDPTDPAKLLDYTEGMFLQTPGLPAPAPAPAMIDGPRFAP